MEQELLDLAAQIAPLADQDARLKGLLDAIVAHLRTLHTRLTRLESAAPTAQGAESTAPKE